MKTFRILFSIIVGGCLTILLLLGMDRQTMNLSSAQAASQVSIPETTVRYVATSGDDSGNDCTTSGNPCATVQYAIDLSTEGDEIRLAAGTYMTLTAKPAPIGYQGSTVISQVIYITKTISIEGGFTTTNWVSPDPVANPTVIDAQGGGRGIFIAGTISPTIAFLNITGGNAQGLGGWYSLYTRDTGGGVYIGTATTTFISNTIANNQAENGGGLFLIESDSSIGENTFVDNTASSGGGIYVYSGKPIFESNTISHNTANGGAGLFIDSSDLQVLENYISSNTGGGIKLVASQAYIFANEVISNTKNNGGGMDISGSDVTLKNNLIMHNQATGKGGGIFINSSDVVLINNVVSNNSTNNKGSGIYSELGESRIIHNTIAGNSGGDGSGIYLAYDGFLTNMTILTNTIISNQSVGIFVEKVETVKINSILWFGNTANYGGEGNILVSNEYAGDPAFETDGYHIGEASAAIDKGIPTEVTDDIDGQTRHAGSAPDLGVDEIKGPTVYLIYLPATLR